MSNAPPDRQLVLLVDDEEKLLRGLVRYLRDLDCELMTAIRGDDAVKLLAWRKPVLIVSDFRLPGLNGVQVLQEARKLYPEVRCILHTAEHELPDDARAFQIVHKPSDPEIFRKLIEAELATQKSR
jgi:DNA-binding NtrC family response regulator